MNVSRTWLQKYFDTELPQSEELADALTFHSSEVEEIAGDRLDVKVLPDRAPYALSHRGIAYEVAAALNLPLKDDPLRAALPDYGALDASLLKVEIESAEEDSAPLAARYMGALVQGVKVGPSPDWLADALKSVGQRSINNVVDATNYVMLNIGQPLHAFDAAKLGKLEDGSLSLAVSRSKDSQKITTLTGEEYTLLDGTAVITDATNGTLLAVAGVKGGKAAEVTTETTDIVIEAANFDGTRTRKASQALKLWTDASLRFQNKISPELAAYGMRDVLALITEVSGGTLVAVSDCYPQPESAASPVTFTTEQINGLLGTKFEANEIAEALTRLMLEFVQEGEQFTVRPYFERRDLNQRQDFAEEVGRVLGYDRVAPESLPAITEAPDQKRFKGIEAMKDVLALHGFTEISTQSFASEGSIVLANPLQSEKPWLRSSLTSNMQDALTRATQVAPRVLGPEPMLKLFELGTVFTKDDEHLSLCLGYRQITGKASDAVLAEAIDALLSAFPNSGLERPTEASGLIHADVVELSLKDVRFEEMGEGRTPAQVVLSAYTPFSTYPSALRDIAVWTPEGTQETEVALLIQKEAGDLLARMDLFDRFEKDGRTSFAFRLVFQASDRTLSDADLDPVMAAMTDGLNTHEGFQVR